MERPLKAVVVDDERLARVELSRLLSVERRISIVAEADTVETAEEVICRHRPDVVFLDIQLGKQSGFGLLNRVGGFEVIFVTAHDRYAIRAFETHALDYLLKPVHPERLASAVGHLTKQIEDKSPSKQTDRDFICVKTGGSFQFVRIQSIVYLVASGDYSEVYTATGQRLFELLSLKEWEQRLAAHSFARIHRSSIVNLSFVDRVTHSLGEGLRVHLKSPHPPLFMSRRYAARLKKIFCLKD